LLVKGALVGRDVPQGQIEALDLVVRLRGARVDAAIDAHRDGPPIGYRSVAIDLRGSATEQLHGGLARRLCTGLPDDTRGYLPSVI
jgi:hypothetical protein